MLKKLATLSLITISLSLTGCGDVKLGTFTPSAPEKLRAVATGTGGTAPVLLTWQATNSTTPNQGATFNVYRGSSASGSTTGKVKIAQGIPGESFTDTTATTGTFSYQVTATIYGLESGPSNEVTVSLQGGVTAPQLSGTSTSGTGALHLNWIVPPGAASYVLYRGTTASGILTDKIAIKALDAGSGTTAFTDTGVSVGSTYFYLLVVRYNNGNSQTSNEVAITVQ